jgi:GNAT superfamily N-acetyltransferase
MSASGLTVRPLETTAERDAFYWLASQAFGPERSEARKEQAIAGRRRYMEQAPGFESIMLRGAFRGSTFLGGYYIQERLLRMGVAWLPTVCIGDVVTHPDYRLQGVATALMLDAIAYARARRQALLLLDGIARFYHRFGYIDMFDVTEQCISRASAWIAAPSPYAVRPATFDDAAVLLALYQRHYGSCVGSFARTLEQEQHQLAGRLATHNPPLLALGPDGQAAGYLFFPWGPDRSRAVEVAADSLSAVMGLLQYHTRLLDTLAEPSAELFWRVPSDSPTVYLLIDHLLTSEVSTRVDPSRSWSVQSQTYHHADTGWLARPGSMQALAEAMLPEWQERWQRGAAHWSGALAFAIGDEPFALDVSSAGIRLLEQIPAQAATVALTPQAFTQMLFGYRPVTWALQPGGQSLPDDLLLALQTLFPPVQTWIAGSDDF